MSVTLYSYEIWSNEFGQRSGADSVVMVEETKLISASDDGQIEIEVEILSDVKVGQEVRPIGSDVCKDEKVLPIGTSLTASDIGKFRGSSSLPS